ncbi:MAG: hypothetical protein D6785_04085 [Planctomycetota bacterium]|nr:MAG: hypothetical protein D6785_04085 [Planctomycetota bacterium]
MEKGVKKEKEMDVLEVEFQANIEKRLTNKEKEGIKRKNQQEIKSWLEKVNKGKILFADVVRKFSKGGNREKGGLEDVKIPSTTLPPAFESQIPKMEIGEIKGPYEDGYSFQALQLLDKKEVSFEKVKYKIAKILLEEVKREVREEK